MSLVNITDSLLAFWPLDEVNGDRADAFGTNDLTDKNTVTSVTPGKVLNFAADFKRNTSEYLEAGTSILVMGDEDFTIAGWFKFDDVAIEPGALVGRWDFAAADREYLLLYQEAPTDRLRFIVSNDGTATTSVNADTYGGLVPNVWTFIVAWHDSANNTISIQVNNGTADSAAHTTGVNSGGSLFRVGGFGTDATPLNGRFDGKMNQVAIWGRKLTAGEKTALYSGGDGVNLSSFLSPTPGSLSFSHLMRKRIKKARGLNAP